MKATSDFISKWMKDAFALSDDELYNSPLAHYMDSLDREILCVELENRYDIQIADEEMREWWDFADIVRCVDEKMGL